MGKTPLEGQGPPRAAEPMMMMMMGRDSSVGIATSYGLDGPGIESRWG